VKYNCIFHLTKNCWLLEFY